MKIDIKRIRRKGTRRLKGKDILLGIKKMKKVRGRNRKQEWNKQEETGRKRKKREETGRNRTKQE